MASSLIFSFRIYYAKLLAPFQKAASISQSHFEKEFAQSKITDNPLEKTTTAYNNINRFFAAFIDHVRYLKIDPLSHLFRFPLN